MRTLSIIILAFIILEAPGQNTSISSSNGSQRITFNRGGINSFNIETRGVIELTDDDKDVKGMSADGYLEINKVVFGSRRTLVITPQGNGLKKEYYEGRTLVPFEPDGRKWMGEILLELVRATTVGAESRVARFFRKGGTVAVLNEIKLIESDYVKVHYANLLMEQNVQPGDYPNIIADVVTTMDSDHYITEFLTRNMELFVKSKEAMDAVFRATGKMDSDHYRTQVIKEALRSGPANIESIRVALQATANMSSDHYKTEVLNALLKQSTITDAVIAEVVNATKGMDSDHYKTIVMKRALEKTGLTGVSFQRVLESVKDMDSDHYKTEVLTSLLQNPIPNDVQLVLINAVSSIESDHYVTVVGKAIMSKQNLSEEAFQKLLEAMAAHKSDYYLSEFLKEATERPNMTKQNMMTILKATANIDSDHYITVVLTNVASWIKNSNDASLKEAYRSAAKKIGSETYYGRAMRAID